MIESKVANMTECCGEIKFESTLSHTLQLLNRRREEKEIIDVHCVSGSKPIKFCRDVW